MPETNLACGIYLQKGDLFVSPNEHGLNLITQFDERTIDAKYAKSLTLNPVDNTNTNSSCGFRVRFICTESDVILSIEGINLEQYRLSLEDAKSLIEYIGRVSAAMWT